VDRDIIAAWSRRSTMQLYTHVSVAHLHAVLDHA
jgi:hypothetical protein